MKVHLLLALAAGFAVLAPIARAHTWADWVVSPPPALQVTFEPGWVTEPPARRAVRPYAMLLEEQRGYAGDLLLAARPDGVAPPGPWTVRLLHSVVAADELLLPEENADEGVVPRVIPAARVRRTVAEETWLLEGDLPVRIPVALPYATFRAPRSTIRHPAALSVRYEVRDGEGTLRARGLLPLFRDAQVRRLLVGQGADDEAIKQLSGRPETMERVGDLPDAMAAYRFAPGIWFTDPLWERTRDRETLLRRLLLSGVDFAGSAGLMEEIRATLGIGPGGQVVAASARAGAWSPSPLLLSSWNPYRARRSGCGFEKNLLNNEVDLVAGERPALALLTTAGLLLFGLGALILLVVGFRCLKGERRVALWWLLPAWTAFACGVLWGGGTLLVDRRPRADVNEYRLVMAGWPEMHCRAVASAMSFEPGRVTWSLPPDAILYGPPRGQLDGWWRRKDLVRTADEVRLQTARHRAGSRLALEAGWFEQAAAPVARAPGQGHATGGELLALEDLDAVFLLAGGRWYSLGNMAPGERADPQQALEMEGNRLPGLPGVLDHAFGRRRSGCGSDSCLQCGPTAGSETVHPAHDWIVVARQQDPAPRVKPLWEQARMSGRILWVVQLP